MNLRNVITAAAVALLPLTASAATIIVPAAGSGPGAHGSQWQSELTLHTAAPRAVTLSISFHERTTVHGPIAVTLQARETISIADIVATRFGVESGTGALVIEVNDRDAKSVAVTSRTFNVGPAGEFGQDIPSIRETELSRAGDIAALTAPSDASATRFNFGVFASDAATIRWDLLRADGTVAASREVTYAAGEHAQYNNGIAVLFGAEQQNNDTIHARVISGRATVYGSIVNLTDDPTFVPGVRTREDVVIQFAGIDLDENGTVDVRDADGDGVLDAPVEVFTSTFPNYFRIVAAGEFGENVEFEIVSSPTRADLLDADGTLRVIASGDVKGRRGEIVVRATTGTSSTLLVIPVLFR